MLLSIITNCWGGRHNYALESVNEIMSVNDYFKDKVEIIVCDQKQSFGKAHNRSVAIAKGKYILKMDCDCSIDLVNFNKIFSLVSEAVSNKSNNAFLNIGVKHTEKKSYGIYGNEYLISKMVWEFVGGEPEWEEYGWEDYSLLAKICKYAYIDLNSYYGSNPTEKTATLIFRDKIARPINSWNKLFMTHHDHEVLPETYEQARNGMKRFYDFMENLRK